MEKSSRLRDGTFIVWDPLHSVCDFLEVSYIKGAEKNCSCCAFSFVEGNITFCYNPSASEF
ncbi:MAG: hypothetical protein LBL98_06285 [Ruminococcus sp.]|nr:hypothetical protein [Ruminococcus sp.]